MPNRRLGLALLPLLACAHLGGAGSAPDGAVVVPLEPYTDRLVTLMVEVKGVATPFLLDTSGGLTVLAPQTAQRLGCAGPPVVTIGSDGAQVALGRCGRVALSIGGQRFESEAGVFDLAKVLPPGLPPLGGVIALGTLEARPFTLELAARRLTLESEASLAARVRGTAPLQVRLQRAVMGLTLDLFVAVRGTGGPLWFELDSTNLGEVTVAKQVLPALAIPEAQGRFLAEGGTGEIDLQLEGLGALPVQAKAGDLVYDGVLSARAVEAMTLTLDLRTGRAWAARAAPARSEAKDL
jgi:hypothetical protein